MPPAIRLCDSIIVDKYCAQLLWLQTQSGVVTTGDEVAREVWSLELEVCASSRTSVSLKLYMDEQNIGRWVKVREKGKKFYLTLLWRFEPAHASLQQHARHTSQWAASLRDRCVELCYCFMIYFERKLQCEVWSLHSRKKVFFSFHCTFTACQCFASL